MSLASAFLLLVCGCGGGHKSAPQSALPNSTQAAYCPVLCLNPAVATNAQDDEAVAWRSPTVATDKGIENSPLLVSFHPHGGTWSAPVQIERGFGFVVSLQMDGAGNVYLQNDRMTAETGVTHPVFIRDIKTGHWLTTRVTHQVGIGIGYYFSIAPSLSGSGAVAAWTTARKYGLSPVRLGLARWSGGLKWQSLSPPRVHWNVLTANVATNQAGKIALVWRDFSGYQAPHVPLDRTHIAVLLPGSHTWKDTKLDPPTLSRCFLPSSCPIALTSDGTVLSAIDQTGGTRFVIVQHGKASVGPRTVLPASYQQTTVVGASNLFSALLYSLPVYSHGTKILPEGFAEASARVGLSSSIIAFKYHKVRGAVFARPVLIPFKNGSYGKAQALPLRSLVGQILDGVAVPDISGTNISDFSTAQVSSAGAHTVGVIPVARGEISMSDLTQAYLTDGSVDFSKLPSMSKIKKDVLGEYVTVFQMS